MCLYNLFFFLVLRSMTVDFLLSREAESVLLKALLNERKCYVCAVFSVLVMRPS